MLDWAQLVTKDPSARSPDTSQVLASVDNWTTNVSYPGYTNAAVAEFYDTGLIPNLLAAVATGNTTPDEAMAQSDQEVRKIYQKWQDLGKA